MAIGTATAIGLGLSGLGLLGNRKTGAEKMMEQNTKQQSGMANMISDVARRQHSMAEPALSKAMQYYTTLAGGSRSAMAGALAPEMNSLMDTYRGAERGMTSRMAPGPSQERAVAELSRQKAGQMGMMPLMARQNAMGQLGQMGGNFLDSGNSMYGVAGGLLGQANSGMGQMAAMQQGRTNNWVDFGKSIGSVFLPYLLNKGNGKSVSAPNMMLGF